MLFVPGHKHHWLLWSVNFSWFSFLSLVFYVVLFGSGATRCGSCLILPITKTTIQLIEYNYLSRITFDFFQYFNQMLFYVFGLVEISHHNDANNFQESWGSLAVDLKKEKEHCQDGFFPSVSFASNGDALAYSTDGGYNRSFVVESSALFFLQGIKGTSFSASKLLSPNSGNKASSCSSSGISASSFSLLS